MRLNNNRRLWATLLQKGHSFLNKSAWWNFEIEWIIERRTTIFGSVWKKKPKKNIFLHTTRSKWLHCKYHSRARSMNSMKIFGMGRYLVNRREGERERVPKWDSVKTCSIIKGKFKQTAMRWKGREMEQLLPPLLLYSSDVVARLPTVIWYEEKYNAITLSTRWNAIRLNHLHNSRRKKSSLPSHYFIHAIPPIPYFPLYWHSSTYFALLHACCSARGKKREINQTRTNIKPNFVLLMLFFLKLRSWKRL